MCYLQPDIQTQKSGHILTYKDADERTSCTWMPAVLCPPATIMAQSHAGCPPGKTCQHDCMSLTF